MAEFDPTQPNDAAEAAFRDAVLGDDGGREQRRARLMAALPRPEACAVPVTRTELAWRWQPYAWGLLAAGLLLATLMALKRQTSAPGQVIEPRLAAGQSASKPVVVAQAEPAVVPAPLPAAQVPLTVPKAARVQPRAKQAAPVVVADAAPQLRREAEAAVSAATESAKGALEPPAAAPPVAAVPVAAAPPPSASNPAQALARADSVADVASARTRMSLAASEAAQSKAMAPADAVLLAAVRRADLAAARAALGVGASVHLRDPQGRTMLMLAAGAGSRAMVELLLAAGARKADRDPQGLTAAGHAQVQGHGQLIDALR